MNPPTRLWPGTTTKDYREAPSGVGPRAADWKDKPTRLVYELCGEVEALQALSARAAALVDIRDTSSGEFLEALDILAYAVHEVLGAKRG